MESQDSKIDGLHQKASAHYLQGEFQAALQAWRELLALDPQDERAIEGVKLCELLADDQAAAATPEAKPAAAPAPPPRDAASPQVEGFDDELEELDAILDSPPAAPSPESSAESFDFAFSDHEEQAVDQPVKAPVEGPERQAGGIDFGNIPEADPLSPGTGGEQQDVQFAFDPQSLDLPQDGPAPGVADPSGTAAAELRHRVQELMAEAQANLERGDRNGALSALNRITILDENNQEALALRQKIEAAAEETAWPDEPLAEAVEPPEIDRQEPIEPAPAIEEGPPAIAEPAETAASTENEQIAEVPFEEEDLPPTQEADAEAEPSVEIAVGVAKPSLRNRLTGMNLAIAGGVLAVIALGGFSAYWFLWGPGAGGQGQDSEEAGMAAAGTLPQLPDLPGEGEAAGQPPRSKGEAKPAKRSAEEAADLAVLLAQAEEAFEKGDYREAVLSYNRVLKVDPDNRTATAKLTVAGERFREQKEQEEKRSEAIEAFNRGNYRAALTIFYRLPDNEYHNRLERYKLNGWYNMGVQALTMGDCNSASTHLKEAKAIDPSDKEVIIALDLARICRYSRSDASYQEEVGQLAYRALED
jgi:tetratricopeptide (TPR) repeat protein